MFNMGDRGMDQSAGASFVSPADHLAALWHHAGLPEAALDHVVLPGSDPVLPSSFKVGTAAQVSLAAAALAAAQLRSQRMGHMARVTVPMREAALESCGWFSLNGITPQAWDPIAGLYLCANGGWVRLHTNFEHHRDGVLRLLALPQGPQTSREQVARALLDWDALAFEDAASQAGLVVAALRSFADWDAHPQGQALAGMPPLLIERIGDAPPIPLSPADAGTAPLAGERVIELTRILAGPVAGRTLAAYGADVMLLNAPHLPNIAAIADTSRGKLSAHVDLRSQPGVQSLCALLREARIFMQGYRPGGLEALGFGPHEVARLAPGIVYVSLSAYGHTGPWSQRRGFDSLVQTATGFNLAEAQAAGNTQPQALPMQILDYASGYLMAFGALAARLRQSSEGGSWLVRVSLAATGHWLRGLGRVEQGFEAQRPDLSTLAVPYESGFGALRALPHPVRFDDVPITWARPSMPPGSHAPVWPADTQPVCP
jgi:crotonobetainyl-CoA:carnitine CoA-transferase CaiB-like acyl-CoA transferase